MMCDKTNKDRYGTGNIGIYFALGNLIFPSGYALGKYQVTSGKIYSNVSLTTGPYLYNVAYELFSTKIFLRFYKYYLSSLHQLLNWKVFYIDFCCFFNSIA